MIVHHSHADPSRLSGNFVTPIFGVDPPLLPGNLRDHLLKKYSQYGTLTFYLTQGLKGQADLNGDKKITAQELQGFIDRQINEALNDKSPKQKPGLYGDAELVVRELE